jgi:Zn-dependent protease with chaperone function
MIHPFPGLFFILSWLLIGPPMPTSSAVAFTAGVLILALALRRSSRYHTIGLLGILGIMLLDSLQIVFAGLHAGPFELHAFHDEVWNFFSTFFTINLVLTVIGALAAVCAAAYIEFGRSRMSVARIFPELRFLDAPKHVKNMVDNLASSVEVQPPEVCLVDSGTPSAFTIRSRRKYVVAVSIGLLESLDREEVEACLAHEISHLKNKDFPLRLLATVAKVALFAKPMSYLIEPAVYRAREFLADRTAAVLIGGPKALISALTKLEESQALGTTKSSVSICMCSLNGGSGFFKILDKHPDIHARIKALQEMYAA